MTEEKRRSSGRITNACSAAVRHKVLGRGRSSMVREQVLRARVLKRLWLAAERGRSAILRTAS